MTDPAPARDGLVEILEQSYREGMECLGMMMTFPTTAPVCKYPAGASHARDHQAAAVRARMPKKQPNISLPSKSWPHYAEGYDAALDAVIEYFGLDPKAGA